VTLDPAEGKGGASSCDEKLDRLDVDSSLGPDDDGVIRLCSGL